MSISTNTIGSGYGYVSGGYNISAADYTAKTARAEETEETAAKSRTDSYESSGTKNTEETAYRPNTALVSQLKQDMETQKLRFLDTVKDLLHKQGLKVAEGDGVWKQIASGNFSVDEETRAAAQASIADGGYWSVEKTSERLVSYAKALVGGDPSKVEVMREAFVKGFQEAEKAWGGSLPEISQKTYDATMKLFDEWAKEAE